MSQTHFLFATAVAYGPWPGIPNIQAIILHAKLMKRSIVLEYRQCSFSYFVTTLMPSQPSVRKLSVRTVRNHHHHHHLAVI
jgi:hypothetical protein